MISQQVVTECSLIASGMTQVQGVNSSTTCPTYLVNVYLPNQVAFIGIRVTLGQITGFDILIGMDIISQGDFAVTNMGGKTKFSFRVPSQVHIDFVKEFSQQKPRAANRGKGKGHKGRNRRGR